MTSKLTLVNSTGFSPIFNKPNQEALFKNLRATAATAAGIEALANQAIEQEDKTESLEHIADLSNRLKEEISRLSVIVAELEPNQ